MRRFPIFYSSLPDIGAGFRPVEAETAMRPKGLFSASTPAITAFLGENITDEKEVRRLFVEWLKTL